MSDTLVMHSGLSAEDEQAFESAATSLALDESTGMVSDDLLSLVPGLIEPNIKVVVRGCIFYYRPIEGSCLADPEQNARLLGGVSSRQQDGSKTLLGLDVRHVLSDIQDRAEAFIQFGKLLKEVLGVDKIVLLRWSTQIQQVLLARQADQDFIFFDERRGVPADRGDSE